MQVEKKQRLADEMTLSSFQDSHKFSRMTYAPVFAIEAQAIFLQLTQPTRVIQDESESSEK